jgi:phosphate uptake regulator
MKTHKICFSKEYRIAAESPEDAMTVAQNKLAAELYKLDKKTKDKDDRILETVNLFVVSYPAGDSQGFK